MVKFLTRATKIRQRAIREDLRIGYGVQWLHITVEQTAQIVAEAQRRFRTHNAARRYVEEEFYSTLALNSNELLDKRTIERKNQRSNCCKRSTGLDVACADTFTAIK